MRNTAPCCSGTIGIVLPTGPWQTGCDNLPLTVLLAFLAVGSFFYGCLLCLCSSYSTSCQSPRGPIFRHPWTDRRAYWPGIAQFYHSCPISNDLCCRVGLVPLSSCWLQEAQDFFVQALHGAANLKEGNPGSSENDVNSCFAGQ